MKSKQNHYFIKVCDAINCIFDEDSEHYIDLEDMMEGDNATDFFHAIGNMLPTHIYNTLTSNDSNTLDFNHIANKLIHQNK